MSWLQILQLATTLLSQALAAFAAGQTKEAPALVNLRHVDAQVVHELSRQHAPAPTP